jgi:glycosyltransferase involved in cell wall biosynthesis
MAMSNRPNLFIVGPLLSRHPTFPVTQAELMVGLFSRAGYKVRATSTYLSRPVRMLDMVWALLRHGRECQIQWLITYSGTPAFVFQDVASWLGKKLGQRVVMIVVGGGTKALAEQHPNWFKRVLGRADAIVATSSFLGRVLEEYGLRYETIPNVVDSSTLPFRLRASVRPRLYWRRAFDPAYNPELAVQTLARVRRVLPDATLTLGGQDKGSLAGVKALSASLGLTDCISFAGFIPEEQKARAWDEHDIYLNTNRIDNFPVTIVEAFSMGLPVVATDVGGVRDLVVDGKTGFLVPSDDPDRMAQAVIRLVQEPRTARRCSEAGAERARSCSWAQVRLQYEDLFERLLAASPVLAAG